MNPEQIKAAVDELPMCDKLALVADIWDSIASGTQAIPLPEWQALELDSRYREYTDGTLALHHWESVHEELRNKYQK